MEHYITLSELVLIGTFLVDFAAFMYLVFHDNDDHKKK